MWSIIGHAPALGTLERALKSENPHHAWLFTGPEGIGKRTAALEFAAALNCLSEDKPCGDCRPCRDTLAGRHADVEVVEPGGICDEAEHRDHADSRDLRICQVRRLERVLSLSPYAGGRRIAIVDDADTLRVEAANAFLKTLEEPPPGTVIVLLAEREERLPDTVISRCQRLDFRPIERDVIAEALMAQGASPEQAAAIAGAASGRLGWALQALQNPALLEERSTMLDQALRIAHASRYERFAWARDAEARGPDARERYQRELRVWEGWWRDVLLATSGSLTGAINSDRAPTLLEEGRLYSPADIARFLRSLLATREHLYANVDAQLALENLTMDLPPPRGAGATIR
jgi:DNA polymerase-3 subunit delta'